MLIKDYGSTRVLTLNRPDVRNALNASLRQSIYSAFVNAKTDNSVRVVVLTGKGKAFCAGLDLKDLKSISEKSREENLADSEALARLFELIYKFPKPVIAALNGHAIAGGAGLASVADIVVMSNKAKLAYTEARIGFVAALVGVFLIRQVGERYAKELLLSARLIEAAEAKTLGLVNEVVTAENVVKRSLEIANELSKNSPNSLKLSKELLNKVQNLTLEKGLEFATKMNAISRESADLKEGVSAFLEKRKPGWQS